MGWVLHGESSHARNIKTTRSGFADDVAQASACKIVLRMSAGSYSGFARHEPVTKLVREGAEDVVVLERCAVVDVWIH